MGDPSRALTLRCTGSGAATSRVAECYSLACGSKPVSLDPLGDSAANMSAPFFFFDELRPEGDAPVRVLARVQVLSSEEGGRTSPFRAQYRPNHNFGAPESRHFYIGQVEIPEGESVAPGETRELVITFLPVVGVAEELKPGRRWRIQEGAKLVALAEVLAVK